MDVESLQSQESKPTSTSDLNPMETQLKELAEENDARILSLAKRGQGVPTALMLSLRLDMLVDLLLSERLRPLFEAQWNQALHGLLNDWEQHVTRNTLLEGVPSNYGN